MYSPYVFAISQLVAETPYSILCAFVYWVIMYWTMGLGKGSLGTAGGGYYLLMLIFVEMFGVTLGQAVASLSPNIHVSNCRWRMGSFSPSPL